jgi:hypothetical protein
MQNLTNPEYKYAVDAMYDRLESYWTSNVKRFFSKTESNYPELKGVWRQYVAWRDMKGQRLCNALEFKSSDYSNITIGAKQILVPLKGGSRHTDLIEYLRRGTRTSPGRYVYFNGKTGDYRKSLTAKTVGQKDFNKFRRSGVVPVGIGQRGPTTNAAWEIWWTVFMNEVDQQLEILADNCADIFVEDADMQLRELLDSEF